MNRFLKYIFVFLADVILLNNTFEFFLQRDVQIRFEDNQCPSYFVFCLIPPDDFTHQGESAGTQWFNAKKSSDGIYHFIAPGRISDAVYVNQDAYWSQYQV